MNFLQVHNINANKGGSEKEETLFMRGVIKRIKRARVPRPHGEFGRGAEGAWGQRVKPATTQYFLTGALCWLKAIPKLSAPQADWLEALP